MSNSERPELVLIAHNIRSLHNVGALFRSCDGAGVKCLYLTGFSGTPPRKEISKTALGAEEFVAWQHNWEIEPVLEQLQTEGYELIVVEHSETSIPYYQVKTRPKMALILSNEVWGTEPETLAFAQQEIHVPMYGEKTSLNVAVCGGVVLYGILEAFRQQASLGPFLA